MSRQIEHIYILKRLFQEVLTNKEQVSIFVRIINKYRIKPWVSKVFVGSV